MPKASAADLTIWIRKHHRPLTKEFHEKWINAGLASLCQSEIRRQQPMKSGRPSLSHPQQGRLPGWEDIPYRIELPHAQGEPRKNIKLLNATLEDLRDRKTLVQADAAAFAAELPQLNELIALMERYDKAQPGITVAEALKLQAMRKTPGGVTRGESSKTA
jgi:hypothetical protein